MSAPRIAALVLAAGRSTRMGRNKLQGDVGGGGLLEAAAVRVVRVEMPDDGVLIDVDSPEVLEALQSANREEPAA